MLKITNLTKKYDNKIAVNNLSLEIKPGEILGFIGHNGAGKTTTIKSIIGIHDFDDGDILIDNISIKDNPMECKKKIAYIPDNPDIYENLTAIQYLNFISDIFSVPASEREILIKKYADTFEITSFLGNLISSYSHGMKQKLVIISTLIHKPKLLIMDEPFVGLDPKAIHTFKEIMQEYVKEGNSIFFSTHVLEVAEKLCDRIALIDKGTLVIEGNTEEVIKDSSLEEVFLGVIDHE